MNFDLQALNFWFKSIKVFLKKREFLSNAIFIQNSLNIFFQVIFIDLDFSLNLFSWNSFLDFFNFLEEVFLFFDNFLDSLLNKQWATSL